MLITVNDKTGAEIERHFTECGSVHDWLTANVEAYSTSSTHPFSVFKNGRFLPFDKLGNPCNPEDQIQIVIEPASDPATWYWIYAAMFVASAYMAYEARQAMKDFQDNDTDGLSAYNSSRVQANQAKKNGIIREMFGTFNVFPDIIIQSMMKRYESYQETIRCLFCIGAGEYAFTGGDIRNNLYIGDTPIDEYENQINVTAYDPGDTLPTINTWFGDAALNIRYVGSGTTCRMELYHTDELVVKKRLKTYVDGVLDLNIAVTSYAQISSLSSYIDGLANYTSSVISNGTVNPLRLIDCKINDIKAAARKLSISMGALYIQWVGAGSCELNIYHNSLGAIELSTDQGLTIDTGRFATLTALASHIDGLADYTCTVSGTGTYSPKTLEPAGLLSAHNIDNPTYLNASPSFIAQHQTRQPHENWYVSKDISSVKIENISNYYVGDATYSYYVVDNGSGLTPAVDRYEIHIYRDATEIFPFENGTYFRINGKNVWFGIYDKTTGEGSWYIQEGDSSGGVAYQAGTLFDSDFGSVSSRITIQNMEVDYPYIEGDDRSFIGGWFCTPESVTTTAIELDFSFDAGLYFINGSGEKEKKSVSLYIFVEAEDGGYQETHSLVVDEIIKQGGGISKSIAFPYAIRPQISIARATPDDFSSSASSVVTLKSVKSLLSTPTSYDDVTVFTAEIFPANNEVSRSSENKINLRGITRKLPTLGELEAYSWGALTSTRSIANALAWILIDAMGQDGVTKLDWDTIEALKTTWDSRSDYFDGEFTDETTLWEAVKIILKPGYAEPSIKNGKLAPVRMAEGSNFTQMFTPDIMTGDGLQIDQKLKTGIEADGIEVEYFDLTSNGMAVINCELSGDQSIRPTRMTVIGVTDIDRAWRLGMRERRILRNRPAMYRFTTEMEGLNCDYGDPIVICSHMFDTEYSSFAAFPTTTGAIVAYSAPTVTLDVDVDFGGDGDYYAMFRDENGVTSGPYSVEAGAGARQITLLTPSTLDFIPILTSNVDFEPTIVAVGPEERFWKRAIVRSITQTGETEVQIVAEEYVEDNYADDDNSAP